MGSTYSVLWLDSTQKLRSFFALRLRRASFTAHCVLRWVLVSAIRSSHRGRCFTVDSDRRFKIASDLQWIRDFGAPKSPRTPHRQRNRRNTGDTRRRVTPQRAPSESGIRIPLSGSHVRNLMNVSRIMLLSFFVFARLSFCSFSFVFRIR